MEITFVGTGGATATPRPFCQCEICEKARTLGEPYKRNSSSLYIKEISGLIDCPEDIGDSVNRRGITDIEHLFITHWHPDHTFGLRVILESFYDFRENKALKKINLYIAGKVYEELMKFYPALGYHANVLKVCDIIILDHRESIEINGVEVTAIGYQGENSSIYGYLLEEGDKRALYTPCDTISWEQEVQNLDLLINECGMFSPEVTVEIAFEDLMRRIETMQVKKTLLTHIEEIELNRYGWDYLREMKSTYPKIDFDFAYDGLTVKLKRGI